MRRTLLLALGFLLCASASMAACPGGSTCVTGMATVATNAALKAATAGFTAYIQRTGYYAAGDGGDAIYQWSSASSCTDDGGSCIIPNSAPGTGRWLLDKSGGVSVKVFGATCDASTDDTAAFNAALAARSAVFVPANTTCAVVLSSSSGGLVLGDKLRLYGQNSFSSKIQFSLGFTPSYNFIAGGLLNYIEVASNVATVVTTWSHELTAGQSVTIAGSATSALNGTYTISSITAPDKFTITTSGVGNGIYTDPTSIVAPSGIGVALIRSSQRDVNNGNLFNNVEVDHLSLVSTSTAPFTWIDASGLRSSQFHNLMLWTSGTTANNQVAIVCADRSPINFTWSTTCFFNHFYDINGNGPWGTTLHWTATDGNSGQNLFERIFGAARVGIDITGTLNRSFGGVLSEWYNVGDGNANSWDIYGGAPGDTSYLAMGFEGFSNSIGFRDIANFAHIPAAAYERVTLPGINSSGSLALNYVGTAITHVMGVNDSTILCAATGTSVSLPPTPAASAPPQQTNSGGGQIVTFRAKGGNATCVISGNGNTIEGSSSNYTLNAEQTITLQWSAGDSDWKIIAKPPGQLPISTVSTLPTCGAAQNGMMFAVSDASSPAYNAHLTGGGTGEFANIPVFCNGTAWTAH